MNNKGFTLVEMLAVVVVLAIVGGIATAGVINAINTSKLKSEKIFVDKLSNLIDDYLDLYPPSNLVGVYSDFDKCKDDECNDIYTVSATQVNKTGNENIYLKDLVDKELMEKADLVNPKNKKQCLSGNGPIIYVYRDDDAVYHYYVDLSSGTSCNISEENALINNMPDNLVKSLNEKRVSLPNNLKKEAGLS